MIALPPYILLIAFGLFFAAFLFFSLTNIILLSRFGARNVVGLSVTFVFLCLAGLVVFVTWQLLTGLDWMTPVPLFSIQAPNV